MSSDVTVQQAKSLQANPLLWEILAEIRETNIRIWESSTDQDAQNRAWSTVRSLKQIESAIRQITAEVQSNGTAR